MSCPICNEDFLRCDEYGCWKDWAVLDNSKLKPKYSQKKKLILGGCDSAVHAYRYCSRIRGDAMTPNKAPGFCVTRHKGFQMTFANGYTVSVQFGPSNYCEHYSGSNYDAPDKAQFWESRDAEIAAWDSNGDWHNHEDWGDDVKGRVSSDDVAAFIEEVRNLPAAIAKEKEAQHA